MTDYDLTKLKMIARGGEAEIYDAGDGKVLRVITKKDVRPSEFEKKLFPLLYEYNICVPRVYEFLEIDGKPAELMQKIDGKNLIDYIKQSPLKIRKIIKRFALVQKQIFDVKNDKLPSITGRVKYFASLPPLLEKPLYDFVLKIFNDFPEENYLCHGDFHPGNILMQDNDFYVIDWSGAYCGSFLCDIAHTYLLMKTVPKIPGQSNMSYSITKTLGAFLANSYLKEIYKLKSFDWADFSKWTVVMSFLRVYYGFPSEKDGRIKYISKALNLYKNNIDAALWYKHI